MRDFEILKIKPHFWLHEVEIFVKVKDRLGWVKIVWIKKPRTLEEMLKRENIESILHTFI